MFLVLSLVGGVVGQVLTSVLEECPLSIVSDELPSDRLYRGYVKETRHRVNDYKGKVEFQKISGNYGPDFNMA